MFQVYKDGKGLCNSIFGSAFNYTENNQDCMTMNFVGANPNANVTKPRPPPTSPAPTTAHPSSGVTRPSIAAASLVTVLLLLFKL